MKSHTEGARMRPTLLVTIALFTLVACWPDYTPLPHSTKDAQVPPGKRKGLELPVTTPKE